MNTIIVLTLSFLFLEINNCLGTVRETDEAGELLAVAVYFRHGDRTPEESFPTDDYFKIENFPMGFGQLTNKGINRHYELGQWFRSRYNTFLPERYSPNDILIRSTDVDRTLMSAAVNLAGLYPPTDDKLWNSNLLWQPIPIHTVPEADDEVIAMEKACAQYDKLYKKEKKDSEYYQQINEDHAELYEYLSNYTGLEVTDISDIKLIRSLFYCYSSYNPSYIPSWADSLNQTELDYLAGLSYGRHTASDDLKLLRAGPFFDYLLNYFDELIDNTTSTQKFFMFSSHDSGIASILDAMGVYDNMAPSFAATIIWELRRITDGTEYINLFYRKDDNQLLNLVVPGCVFDCPYDYFKTLMEDVTADTKTWEKKCKN